MTQESMPAVPVESVSMNSWLKGKDGRLVLKRTRIPGTGLARASKMRTVGGEGAGVPTTNGGGSSVSLIMVAGGPAMPVAEKVTETSPAIVAIRVFAPTVGPSVQLLTRARPSRSVVWEGPVSRPDPVPTSKVTGTPATGGPAGSRMRTVGGVATEDPATAVWVVTVTAWMVRGRVPGPEGFGVPSPLPQPHRSPTTSATGIESQGEVRCQVPIRSRPSGGSSSTCG